MFFDIFKDFISSILGETASATPQGQLFLTYGSFFLCACVLFLLYKIVKFLMFRVFR